MTELKINPDGENFKVSFQCEDVFFSTLSEAVNFVNDFAYNNGDLNNFKIEHASFCGTFKKKERK